VVPAVGSASWTVAGARVYLLPPCSPAAGIGTVAERTRVSRVAALGPRRGPVGGRRGRVPRGRCAGCWCAEVRVRGSWRRPPRSGPRASSGAGDRDVPPGARDADGVRRVAALIANRNLSRPSRPADRRPGPEQLNPLTRNSGGYGGRVRGMWTFSCPGLAAQAIERHEPGSAPTASTAPARPPTASFAGRARLAGAAWPPRPPGASRAANGDCPSRPAADGRRPRGSCRASAPPTPRSSPRTHPPVAAPAPAAYRRLFVCAHPERDRLVIAPGERRRAAQRARQVERFRDLHGFLRSLQARPPGRLDVKVLDAAGRPGGRNSGAIRWPPMGRSDGRRWGRSVAPTGRCPWPRSPWHLASSRTPTYRPLGADRPRER
jgi:hypothetical protein